MPVKPASWLDSLYEAAEIPQRMFDAIPVGVQDRLVGAMLFIPGAMVLGIARYLTANPAGVGTHRQLGLGACTVMTLTGYPCPMCGMTTTFTHLAHLHLIQGTINQPFGLLLFLATVYVTAIGGLDLLMPRARWRSSLAWVESHETAIAVTLLAGMGLGWVYKIVLLAGFLPWSP